MTMIQKYADFNMNDFINEFLPAVNTGDKIHYEYIEILRRHECPITVSDPKLQPYLDQIMNNVKLIPDIKLPSNTLNIDVFTAEMIDIKKDDTKEIKDIIRKMNRKVACYTCDHTKFEKKKIDYQTDVMELCKSKHLKRVYEYYLNMVKACQALEGYPTSRDAVEKHKPFHKARYWVLELIDSNLDLQQVQKEAVEFNKEVIKVQSKYLTTHCPKCEKIKKEYDFVLSDIEQMRDEIKDKQQEEINRILQEVEANDSPIIEFMNKYFSGKDKIKVSDITRLWKADKKVMIRNDEIREKLEESGEWVITNNQHVIWANRKSTYTRKNPKVQDEAKQ